MKKHRKAKQFLDELRNTPIVSAVCKQLDISRQTISRWSKTDPEFKKMYEECMSQGTDNVNDLAISQTINKIRQGDSGMIKFWLSHNHERFMRKPQEMASNEDIFNPSLERKVDFVESAEAMLMKKVKEGDLDAIKHALQYNSGRYHPMKAGHPFLDMTDSSDPFVQHIVQMELNHLSRKLKDFEIDEFINKKDSESDSDTSPEGLPV